MALWLWLPAVAGAAPVTDYDWLKDGVVGIAAISEGLRKSGTGVVVRVDERGISVLTAAHVVEGDAKPC